MIVLSGFALSVIIIVSCIIITTIGLLIYNLFIDDNSKDSSKITNYNPNIQYINDKLLSLTIAAGQFDQWYSPPPLPVV